MIFLQRTANLRSERRGILDLLRFICSNKVIELDKHNQKIEGQTENYAGPSHIIPQRVSAYIPSLEIGNGCLMLDAE